MIKFIKNNIFYILYIAYVFIGIMLICLDIYPMITARVYRILLYATIIAHIHYKLNLLKMFNLKFIKCGYLHRLGNIITALISLAESLVVILTFGYIYPNWLLSWVVYRLDTCLYEIRKDEES